jgi:hypothetical protein
LLSWGPHAIETKNPETPHVAKKKDIGWMMCASH